MPGRIARKALSVCLPLRAAPCVGLAALGLIVSTDSLQTVVANGDTRSITLQHTHRDDSITVTFKRNGRYDEDGLKKLNYFLRDWRNDDQTRDGAAAVRHPVGGLPRGRRQDADPHRLLLPFARHQRDAAPALARRRPVQPAHARQGDRLQHRGRCASRICALAGLRLQRGGVGFYPGSFVHVDVGTVRHWPRMTHDQLARVFPNGRTVHVPSDGQPLPGYALALADIEKRGSSPSGMSLAAARNAGAVSDDRIASAGSKKGGILSKLFGFSTDEDEDEDCAAGSRRARRRRQTGSRNPSRRACRCRRRVRRRSTSRRASTKPAGGFALASATSVAVTLPPARDVPRPPAEMTGAAAARAETTASITSWLNDTEFGRTDRVPPGMALAYAAQAVPDRQRPVALTPPMGATHADRRDHAGRPHPAEGRPALQRSLDARHHAGDQRALRDERDGLRQARRAPGAHDDDQAGLERRDGLRRRSL